VGDRPDRWAAQPSYDFLELLLAALARHGLPYRPVAVNVNFASDPTPISTTTAARLTDRDVIIARTGLPGSRLKVSNPESHNFTASLVIPSAIPGLSFRVPRGWSAVEVKLRGKTVRSSTPPGGVQRHGAQPAGPRAGGGAGRVGGSGGAGR
jgi:hypothetical protein